MVNRRQVLVAGLSSPALALAPHVHAARRTQSADIVVYGATSAGIVAALQAAGMDKSVLLIEPGPKIGGLTAGGLGQTDIGNKAAIGGRSQLFYRKVEGYYASVYGKDAPQHRDCRDGYRFEPHVAEFLYENELRERGIEVFRERRLKSVKKQGTRITEITMEDGSIFRGKIFIDSTYEGDLMAKAGVSFHVGREANSVYGETLNGIQFGHPGHAFKGPVDPYVREGDPSSGLLKGVTADPPGTQGAGDRRVQAYNFRMCLTDDPANQVPFPKPAGYDSERYTLLARYLKHGFLEIFGNHQPMPNRKSDTNNHGAFGTDNIGMNYAYPDGDWATRERIFQEHLTYQQGLMWFLANDERVPPDFRKIVNKWGLAKDEFKESGNWPHQLYIREARRMISDTVMTEHHCRGRIKAEDPVGLAAYNMDSHHCRRIVIDGMAVNEGDVQVPVSPYPIAYRSIVPKQSECENLLVPVCLSSSHISYGSIRMEPVFMILGQSAATAACHALDERRPVQQIDTSKLMERLRRDGQVLEWRDGMPGDRRVAARIDSKSLPGVVLDDSEAVKQGEWLDSDRAGDRKIGTGYLHDGNTNKGRASLTYVPDLPREAEYEIRLYSPPNANRATNVPVTIRHNGSAIALLEINQRRSEGGGIEVLGRFRLPAGKATQVEISNAGTDGYVVADGIQFLPMG